MSPSNSVLSSTISVEDRKGKVFTFENSQLSPVPINSPVASFSRRDLFPAKIKKNRESTTFDNWRARNIGGVKTDRVVQKDESFGLDEPISDRFRKCLT